LNWAAVVTCVIVGQVLLTIWFAAVFARPWAQECGADDPKQHTREVPGYTYAIGALCVFLLSLGMANLQAALGVETAGDGILFGIYVAIHFSVATSLPGYAFLKRYRAFTLAIGAQTLAIVVLSTILAVWQA
jgi:hypothetical protein